MMILRFGDIVISVVYTAVTVFPKQRLYEHFHHLNQKHCLQGARMLISISMYSRIRTLMAKSLGIGHSFVRPMPSGIKSSARPHSQRFFSFFFQQCLNRPSLESRIKPSMFVQVYKASLRAHDSLIGNPRLLLTLLYLSSGGNESTDWNFGAHRAVSAQEIL